MDAILGSGVEGGGGKKEAAGAAGGGGGGGVRGAGSEGQDSTSSLLGGNQEVDLPKIDAEFLRINNNRLEHIQV